MRGKFRKNRNEREERGSGSGADEHGHDQREQNDRALGDAHSEEAHAHPHDKNPSYDPAMEMDNGSEISEQIARLQGELAEAEKQVLMAQADLENFRRRLRRDAEEQVRYASVPLVGDLLDVADNLQRALGASQKDAANSELVRGVQMVADQLHRVLEKHGCQRMQTVGQPFDPNFHEAIQVQASDEVPPQHVLFEVRSGYLLHDRVVRPAQVILAAPPD